MTDSTIEIREAEHWDGVAHRVRDEELVTLPEIISKAERRRLALMGELLGRRVLDVGCGSGEWSARLAKAGANVEGIDISAGMVDVTRRRADLLGVGERVTARVMSAMKNACESAEPLSNADFDGFSKRAATMRPCLRCTSTVRSHQATSDRLAIRIS